MSLKQTKDQTQNTRTTHVPSHLRYRISQAFSGPEFCTRTRVTQASVSFCKLRMIGIGFDFEDFSYLIHRIMYFSDSHYQPIMFMVWKSTWNTHHTMNIISRPIQQWHWHTSWIHGTYRCWGWRQAYSSPRLPIVLQSKLGIPLPQYAQTQRN